jgi:hypothetical protein
MCNLIKLNNNAFVPYLLFINLFGLSMIKKLFIASLMAFLCVTAVRATEHNSSNSNEKWHKRFIYRVAYGHTKIGKLTRDVRRNNDKFYLGLSADLSFLFLKLGGYQNSVVNWEPTSNKFLTHTFTRRTSGLENINVSGVFSEDAHSTTITMDGKTTQYSEAENTIVDLNALFLQVRYGLMQGQRKFDFYMQTSDSVSHYFFEVKAEESIKTKFGDLKTYRIEQTKVKNRKLSVWFAPSLGTQMVKFHYKRKILDINGELTHYYD